MGPSTHPRETLDYDYILWQVGIGNISLVPGEGDPGT